MKRMYWRPGKVSRRALIGISLLAVFGMALVWNSPTPGKAARMDQQLAAARLARVAMQVLRDERLRRGHDIDTTLDPTGSGMVGSAMTLVTSRPADLTAKQTSVNPNFAAAVVDMLARAGVHRGDTIAVGWSGSFPALNVAVCAAIETLQLKPIVVASATSSQYGANLPDWMWLDMERMLCERGVISFRSAAASLGGAADRGMGMSPDCLALVQETISRNNVTPIKATRRQASIDERMHIYTAAAHDIKAYINVGGGVASTGGTRSKHLFQPGLNRKAPAAALEVDSVMARFARRGTPVIHLLETERLAGQYRLAIAPSELPAVGDGAVYGRIQPNRWLAAAVLVVILAILRVCVWTDWPYRLRQFFSRSAHPAERAVRLATETVDSPQLMV